MNLCFAEYKMGEGNRAADPQSLSCIMRMQSQLFSSLIYTSAVHTSEIVLQNKKCPSIDNRQNWKSQWEAELFVFPESSVHAEGKWQLFPNEKAAKLPKSTAKQRSNCSLNGDRG